MSGLTPLPIVEFRRLLRGRGSSIELLAGEVGAARNTLWRLLRGHGENDETLKRLHACTTADEWARLCQLEHFATWNAAQNALESADPSARPWLMLQECMHCHGDRRFVACRRRMAREVTHGLCPDCLRVHFPDFAAKVLARAAQPVAA